MTETTKTLIDQGDGIAAAARAIIEATEKENTELRVSIAYQQGYIAGVKAALEMMDAPPPMAVAKDI